MRKKNPYFLFYLSFKKENVNTIFFLSRKLNKRKRAFLIIHRGNKSRIMNRIEIFKATALFNLPVTSAMSRKIKINKNCNGLKAEGKTTPSFSWKIK